MRNIAELLDLSWSQDSLRSTLWTGVDSQFFVQTTLCCWGTCASDSNRCRLRRGGAVFDLPNIPDSGKDCPKKATKTSAGRRKVFFRQEAICDRWTYGTTITPTIIWFMCFGNTFLAHQIFLELVEHCSREKIRCFLYHVIVADLISRDHRCAPVQRCSGAFCRSLSNRHRWAGSEALWQTQASPLLCNQSFFHCNTKYPESCSAPQHSRPIGTQVFNKWCKTRRIVPSFLCQLELVHHIWEFNSLWCQGKYERFHFCIKGSERPEGAGARAGRHLKAFELVPLISWQLEFLLCSVTLWRENPAVGCDIRSSGQPLKGDNSFYNTETTAVVGRKQGRGTKEGFFFFSHRNPFPCVLQFGHVWVACRGTSTAWCRAQHTFAATFGFLTRTKNTKRGCCPQRKTRRGKHFMACDSTWKTWSAPWARSWRALVGFSRSFCSRFRRRWMEQVQVTCRTGRPRTWKQGPIRHRFLPNSGFGILDRGASHHDDPMCAELVGNQTLGMTQ